MPHSDSGPNQAEIDRWTGRLDELYQLALIGERSYLGKGGEERSYKQADVKGALDVIRFALQLHGVIPREEKAAHKESCQCTRCARYRSAETEVTAKVRQLREVAG